MEKQESSFSMGSRFDLLPYFILERSLFMKYLIGGLVGSLFLYSLGATYLLCNRKRGLF